MVIENRVFRFEPPRGERWLPHVARAFSTALPEHSYPLRFSLVSVNDDEVVVEATLVGYEPDGRFAAELSEVELLDPRPKTHQGAAFCAVQIVPTGVGCEFGGYAGDATPATNLLAATVDHLVTHPNAVNASELNERADNVLYVE